MKIAILGRETNLCRAEIEALSSNVAHLCDDVSLFEDTQDIPIDRTGGIIKLAQVAADQSISSVNGITSQIENIIYKVLTTHKLNRKVSFGISLYGDKSAINKLHAGKLGLNLKKTLTRAGISCRYVAPKNGPALSAAQVIFNNLLGPETKGFDFVCVLTDNRLIIGFSTAVQNIISYTKRDRERPCRDMVVGMLPPKLAQIMINLARPKAGQMLVDPFCGSGVVLQEALLLGFDVVGSDLSSKMVSCSQKNLAWLQANYDISKRFQVSKADATELTTLPKNCAIVSEGYLGKPLSAPINEYELEPTKDELARLYIDFLKNLATLESSPQKVVLSLPVWRTKSKILTLGIIDQIHELGYTLEQFGSSDGQDLIYLRDKQTVGRQVLVLHRKAI